MFLPGKCHGQRSLVGYRPQGHKEPDTTEWPNKNSNYTWGWSLAGTQKMFTDGREKKKRQAERKEGMEGGGKASWPRVTFPKGPLLQGGWGAVPPEGLFWLGSLRGQGAGRPLCCIMGTCPLPLRCCSCSYQQPLGRELSWVRRRAREIEGESREEVHCSKTGEEHLRNVT